MKAAAPRSPRLLLFVGACLAAGSQLHAQPPAVPPQAEAPPAATSPDAAHPPEQSHAAAEPAALPPAPKLEPHSASTADQRRAVHLYLKASKLFEASSFEEAMRLYSQAATLDPSISDYALAAQVARSHAVTALVQQAARDRNRGDEPAAVSALAHALQLDPKSPLANEHVAEIGDRQIAGLPAPLYAEASAALGQGDMLEPQAGVRSFHLHTDQRTILNDVFRAYGIATTLDASVRANSIHFDMDGATFAEAAHTVADITGTFYVALDAHRVIVARDTRENRQQFLREELENLYLPGLSATELTELATIAKTVFDAPQTTAQPGSGILTIHAPISTLNAFNETMRQLVDGRNQVLLDVRMIQLAHNAQRNTGLQLPQQMAVFNVAAEAQSILNANQTLVQQIIASGLASPGDTLAILAILLASGQVSNSILSNGFATFGGGALATTGFSPGPVTLNLSLNSSDTRTLDQIQLRLGDGEDATLRMGERYPIQTSTFSSLSSSGVNIPGLTGAGSSSSLTSLLSSVNAVPPVPQVEYQDLGLTLKATPKVMRNNEVALSIDMKIDALTGSSLNGNPILNDEAYSGVVTLREGEGVVVASELSSSESNAISGQPGISEVPGLNNLTGVNNQSNKSTLLIIMTPHVIRATQPSGHTQMILLEKGVQGTH